MKKLDLKSFDIKELEDIMIRIDEKSFRAKQLFKWIHGKLINELDETTVFSSQLKDKLDNRYYIGNLKLLKKFESKLDDTIKYLFLLEDNNIIESVRMKYKHGNSLCLSTQVGCKMGCDFCASTKEGLVRNLSSSEILDQVYKIKKDINEEINNIVLMGSGEPLDNYDNVIKFIKLINSSDGQNLGIRNITLSTCGLVPEIYKLAEEDLQMTLSISLHSSSNEERKRIMPIANKYSIEEIIDATKYYIEKTNRRVTFEYTLINNINDKKEDAYKLSKLLKGMLCHVNIIPLNPIKGSELIKSNYAKEFKDLLVQKGINVTIRREMGSDINAACGQLKSDYMMKL
ncbi:23S rRNA (adenine(2503)-C(2))-methyltransferase RlmN [Clostridium sp. D2Q-14]|uniref:23S rRNA (adenine(2503)-C(2))-methyltransferase RlmN n=1 Tax=Anaeromonas gelatinilytica TaxID=2683194 RepID=UPI00193B7F3C|nr:23S rRNA (adenine(2503)-C(2))-methyltransferase RlmN [Anaeromonas gelatinilytica]MBS4536108.1 23S rRNA (adenine(2503)-C(2))-methyltransferase RlmN [Anaeromonas gelatinilytica]